MHPEKMNRKELSTIHSFEEQSLQLRESIEMNIIYKQKIDIYYEQLSELQDENKKILLRLEQCEQHLYAITHSRSWKITAPMRTVGRHIKKLLLITLIRKLIKKVLKYSISFISKRPFLKRIAINFLNKFPGIKSRIRSIAVNSIHQDNRDYYFPINNFDNVDFSLLSPFALKIYYKMKENIKNKENSR
ncbi:hypothetical protein [Dickeya undicola]|uniref:hypothetical protein n=1 Tax=Dickeya undicola TaxID=1577887 RepID=UPI000532F568|nr:hypothetical protein [Dickeya undicola]